MADKQPPAAEEPPQGSTATRLPRRPPQVTDDKTVISQRTPYGEGTVFEPDGPHEDPRSVLVGCQLQHFQLEHFIGGGGMGMVFRGTDLELDRPVAVKVLTQHHDVDEEMVRRFRQEAQSAARLNHKNIAQVYYVGSDAGWNFIAFEFVEGENVRDQVSRDGALPVRQAIEYITQISVALEHAHQRGVIHRDIKPSNIVITPDGQAKLVDMGLARLNHMDSGYDDLTASGVTLGTFDYISPEQGRDPRSADIRSDLYSLGCTLYFMLTCRPPFPEGTVLQKLLHHANARVPDPRHVRPDLPAELVRIVMKMLAKTPKRRYQHPRDLCLDLMQVAKQVGVKVETDPDSVVSRALEGAQRERRRMQGRMLLIPAVATILLALYADGFPLTGSDASQKAPPAFSLPAVATAPREPADTTVETPRPPVPPISESTDREPGTAPKLEADQEESTPRLTPGELSSPATTNNTAPPSGDEDAASVIGTEPQDAAADESTDGLDDTMSTPFEAPEDSVPGPGVEPLDRREVRTVIVGSAPEGMNAASEIDADVAYVDTLAAAISLAEHYRELRTIELQFDGRRETPPISLNNMDLIVRAAEGYSPIIVFHPRNGNVEAGDTDMITLVGGTVTFEGVHFELDIPESRLMRWGVQWSLFALDSVELLKFKGCWITASGRNVESGYEPDVAVVRLADGHGIPVMPGLSTTEEPQNIVWQDCVVRALGDVVRCEEVKPVRIALSNGFVASNRHLLAMGNMRATGAMGVAPSAKVQLNLDRVTSVTGQGLCQLLIENRYAEVPSLSLICTDCAMLLPSATALVEQISIGDEPDAPEPPLSFAGQYNYRSDEAFFLRRIVRATNGVSEREEAIRFDEWQRRTSQPEQTNMLDALHWDAPVPALIRPGELTPEQFWTQHQTQSPARGGGRNGSNAGFDLGALPVNPLAVD